MKKGLLFMAAISLVAFASCSKDNEAVKDNGTAQNVTGASDIKFNITVADMPVAPGTKAAKTGWVDGDKINIWVDDLDFITLMGDHIGRAELTLTYDGEKWTGAFDEEYVTHVDEYGKPNGLPHTIEEAGMLNCLYEGSNDISKYSVDCSDYEYTFTLPVNGDAPVTPLICYANTSYTYNDDTQTLSATISGWTVLTMIQVVVPDLDSSKAEDYTLSCDNMYNLSVISINSETGDVYADGSGTESPTCGISNADGVAFCFYEVWDSDEPFTFTLSDGTDSWIYEAGNKEIETSSERVKFIKLPSLSTAGKWTK